VLCGTHYKDLNLVVVPNCTIGTSVRKIKCFSCGSGSEKSEKTQRSAFMHAM